MSGKYPLEILYIFPHVGILQLGIGDLLLLSFFFGKGIYVGNLAIKAKRKDIYSSQLILNNMDIEAEVLEMKQMLIDISRKIDDLLEESEIAGLMKLSEESISELYEGEPDLYSVEDLKVRYK